MYSSQDDLFSVDLLEKNYNKAIDSNADVVIPDMSYYWDTPVASQNNLGIYGIGGDRTKELSGREAFVLSLDWTIHGFALYRMDIIKKIGFSNYGLSSDEYSTRMFFFNSNKIAFSDGVFYYRQDNSEAITKKWSISQLGYIETCNRLEEFAFKNGFKENEIKIIYKTLLNELIRIQLLYSRNINNITQKDRGEYIKNIKMICKINSHKIKAIEVNNFKELVKKYLCLNYWGLVFLCKNIEYRLIYNNRV